MDSILVQRGGHLGNRRVSGRKTRARLLAHWSFTMMVLSLMVACSNAVGDGGEVEAPIHTFVKARSRSWSAPRRPSLLKVTYKMPGASQGKTIDTEPIKQLKAIHERGTNRMWEYVDVKSEEVQELLRTASLQSDNPETFKLVFEKFWEEEIRRRKKAQRLWRKVNAASAILGNKNGTPQNENDKDFNDAIHAVYLDPNNEVGKMAWDIAIMKASVLVAFQQKFSSDICAQDLLKSVQRDLKNSVDPPTRKEREALEKYLHGEHVGDFIAKRFAEKVQEAAANGSEFTLKVKIPTLEKGTQELTKHVVNDIKDWFTGFSMDFSPISTGTDDGVCASCTMTLRSPASSRSEDSEDSGSGDELPPGTAAQTTPRSKQ